MTKLQEKVLICIKSMGETDIPITKLNIIDFSGGSFSMRQLGSALSALVSSEHISESDEGVYKAIAVVAEVVEPTKTLVAEILTDRFAGYRKGTIVRTNPLPTSITKSSGRHVRIYEE